MVDTDVDTSYNLQKDFTEIQNNLGLPVNSVTPVKYDSPVKCDSDLSIKDTPLLSLFDYKSSSPLSPSKDGGLIRDYSREVKLSNYCYKFQQSLSLNESSLISLNQEIKELKIKNRDYKEQLKIKNIDYDESIKGYIYKEKKYNNTIKELENENKILNDKLLEMNKVSRTTKRNIFSSLIRTKEINRILELKIAKLNTNITDINNIKDKDQSNLNKKIKNLVLHLSISKTETLKWKSNFEDIYNQLTGIEPIVGIIPGLNKEIKNLKKELQDMKIENHAIMQQYEQSSNESKNSKTKLENFIEESRQTYEDNGILEEKIKRLFKERSCLLSYLLCAGIEVPQDYIQELESGSVIEEEFDSSNDDND
jgi:hypothetical protein